MKDKYRLRVSNELVEVTKEVYTVYYKEKRREKYIEERDLKHGKTLYHSLDTDEYTGEEIISDKNINVEESAILNLMSERLHKSMLKLSHDELFLINEFYFNDKSEKQISRETGIPRKTISYRKQQILLKLKKLLKN